MPYKRFFVVFIPSLEKLKCNELKLEKSQTNYPQILYISYRLPWECKGLKMKLKISFLILLIAVSVISNVPVATRIHNHQPLEALM